MKPLGVSLKLGASGQHVLRCSSPSMTEDAIWEAVETAQMEGWTPKRFIAEVSDAWEDRRKRELADELKEFDR